MNKKIVILICMLLVSMTTTSIQSQMIIGKGRTFVVTETIDLSNYGGTFSGYTDWSQFSGVYEIDLEMTVYGDVTGIFITNFSVNGMNDALKRCRVNNLSTFILPDGAMLIDEHSNIVFDIDLKNFTMIGEGDNYKEFVSIPIPKLFQKILNRTHFNFTIHKRSERDSVFLVRNEFNGSTIFKITGDNYMISGIQIRFCNTLILWLLFVLEVMPIYLTYIFGIKEVRSKYSL